MAKSPSITIREIDASSYTVTDSRTILAIVGFASKGPVGEAQLVTSRNEFIEKYGDIPALRPYGNLAAYKAFNYTNKVIYYRVASEDQKAEYVILNANDAQGAYVELSSPETSLYLEAGSYGFSLKLGEDVASDVEITITTEGWYTLQDIVTLINAEFTDNTIDAEAELVGGKLRIAAGTDTTLIVTDPVGASESLLVEEFLGTASDVVPPVDAKLHSETDTILIRSKESGSSTNNISLRKSSSVNPVNKDETLHTFTVLYKGSFVEEFPNLSLDPDSDDYFLKIINKDEENGGSKWISIELERNGVAGNVLFPDGTYALGSGNIAFAEGKVWEDGEYDYKEGTDGIPEGSSNSLFVTALSSSSDLGNSELFDFDILSTPDNGTTSVQNAAISLAESRQDFIYIADPPFGLSYDEATEWHNGNGYGRNTALNSSYAVAYWSWLKDYNVQADEYTWVPPSVYIGELFLKTDKNNYPWSAPAGDRRGRIITSDIEHSPSLAEREVLYGDMNVINPIVEFPSKGIIVYGQKTTLRANSAVNRINVRRMLIYVKKLIKNSVEGLIFEPHTPESWNRASSMVTNILESLRAQGGIDSYTVNINAATNTQNYIAQGIMRGVITIVPVGTIERIQLDVKFLSPGATISE